MVCSKYSRFNRKKHQSVTMKVRQSNDRLVPSTFDTTARLSPLRYTLGASDSSKPSKPTPKCEAAIIHFRDHCLISPH